MKMTRNRKMHRFLRFTDGVLSRNIVLFGGMMLPYIIMPSVNLKTAVALTGAMLFSVLFGTAACALISRQEAWVRYIVITLASLGGVAVSRLAIRLISTEIFDTLGIYLPLMAVNSIVVIYAADRLRGRGTAAAFGRGLLYVLGFGLVACTVGLVRELLIGGTVWGVKVAVISFPAAGTVFFGFMLVAFLGALMQGLRRSLMALNQRLDNPTAEELERQREERMVD